jgi:hypothetical protein
MSSFSLGTPIVDSEQCKQQNACLCLVSTIPFTLPQSHVWMA